MGWKKINPILYRKDIYANSPIFWINVDIFLICMIKNLLDIDYSENDAKNIEEGVLHCFIEINI